MTLEPRVEPLEARPLSLEARLGPGSPALTPGSMAGTPGSPAGTWKPLLTAECERKSDLPHAALMRFHMLRSCDHFITENSSSVMKLEARGIRKIGTLTGGAVVSAKLPYL